MLGKTIHEFKRILQHKFESVDVAISQAIAVLIHRNFPGAHSFSMDLHMKNQALTERLKNRHNEYLSQLETLQQSLCTRTAPAGGLAQRLLMARQESLHREYQNNVLKMYNEKYKALHQSFKEIVVSRYIHLCDKKIGIDPIFMAIVEWLEFGLENLASVTYSAINFIGDYLAKRENPQQLSSWQKIKQSLTQCFVSGSGAYDAVIGTIFDIEHYNLILAKYSADSVFKVLTIPDITTSLEPLEATQSWSDSISSVLSSGAIDINKIVEFLSGTGSSVDALGSIKAEHIFMTSLFSELKDFVRMIKALKADVDLSDITQVIDMVAESEDSNDIAVFALNECVNWLSAISKKWCTAELISIQPLIQRYLKLIDGYRLVDIQRHQITGGAGLEAYLREISIATGIYTLGNATVIRNRFMESYVINHYIGLDIIPSFIGLQKMERKVQSGSQAKAIGTGFYAEIDTGKQYFVKRTTKLHLIADDFSEILATSFSQYLGIHSFAKCKPIVASTQEVYIASECSTGFSPLFDMKDRLTTRLMPSERVQLFSKLPGEILKQLRDIVLMCTLLSDTDPNPGNVGKTQFDGINKIDHGWAFDQICKPFLATWHDTLNPLRYPGRFAPTNALCDYANIFKTYNFSLIESISRRITSSDCLHGFILDELQKICEIYIGSQATGSLKDKIEITDIVKALCQRFGLGYQPEIDLSHIASKLSDAIYIRSQNLYLLCLLENVAHIERFVPMSLLRKLEAQLTNIIDKNVPLYNLPLVKKYWAEIKERSIGETIQSLMSLIARRTVDDVGTHSISDSIILHSAEELQDDGLKPFLLDDVHYGLAASSAPAVHPEATDFFTTLEHAAEYDSSPEHFEPLLLRDAKRDRKDQQGVSPYTLSHASRLKKSRNR